MKLQLVDRLVELSYRFRPIDRTATPTWPLTAHDLGRISITWPTVLEWPPAGEIMQTLKEGLARLGVIRHAPTPQEHGGVILLHCVVDGSACRVSLDYADNPDRINEGALAQSAVYLKDQFRSGGYADPRIVPGGYVASSREFYRYCEPFRRRFGRQRTIDVFARFGFDFQGELRRKAVSLLSAAGDLRVAGTGPRVRYSRFVRDGASARLCLHLPGNGPFTYRVVEFLGLGSCMVSPRFTTELHRPLLPGVHYVPIADDLGDLVEVCRHYLVHAEEREAIAAAGRRYFEQYLHFDQLAAYTVRTILDASASRTAAAPGAASGAVTR